MYCLVNIKEEPAVRANHGKQQINLSTPVLKKFSNDIVGGSISARSSKTKQYIESVNSALGLY
jgi:hypothetical protein